MNENTMSGLSAQPPAEMQGGERPALNKQAILDIANRDPRFQQAIDMIEQQIAGQPIMAADVQEVIKMLEFVLQHPEKYPEVRAAAIKDGVVTEEQAPPQFDQVFVVSLLVALYGIEERLTKQGFARGGLASARRLAAQGRGGDTMLAHINPREAEVLRRMGGSGTINPNTGLREFKGGILGAVLPIALSVVAPGIGTAIGGALGATGVGASILGSAVIGGASAALTGGNALQGALMGGLGGGLGGMVGSAANNALGLGLGEVGTSILGSGLVGGAYGAATGKGFLGGATQGAIGGYLGNQLGGAPNSAISAGGRSFGNALTAGYDPKTAALTALASGATSAVSGAMKGTTDPATGLKMKPADMTVDGLKVAPSNVGSQVPSGIYPDPYNGGLKYVDTGTQNANYSLSGSPTQTGVGGGLQGGAYGSTGVPIEGQLGSGLTAPANNPIGASIGTQAAGGSGGGFGGMGGNLATLALLSSLQKPPEAQRAIDNMSPSQQEYFNRPSVRWDWTKMQQDANRANQSLDSYMAMNWNKITSGAYNTPVVRAAQGGALSMIGRFAEGAGSGREDTIDAKLSDGEYVMDAETVALLGDGSNKEGALRLDGMRQQLRKQKGKQLAKGKFSPNAKSPLQYLKEVA